MQTIFQVRKIYRRLVTRLPAAKRAANHAMLHLSPSVYMERKARASRMEEMIKSLPLFLAGRRVPTKQFPNVPPVRCALPKKQQRKLGLLPQLPNPNLCLAA
jgi:hypothetical protein